MSFNNITVTLAKHEIDNLIKAEVHKSFPNHIVQTVKFSADGTAEVALNQWAACIPAMVTLYDELLKHGRDKNNEYEIGSCDRYVSYVPWDGAKVMFFRNQNVSYLVTLRETSVFIVNADSYSQCLAYTMHVRVLLKPRSTFDAVQSFNATSVKYKTVLKGCESEKYDNTASDYFQYQDIRDRGYIVTVKPEIFSKEELFYKIERYHDAHPHTNYILSELSAYASMMNESIAELNGVDNS